MKQRLLFVGRLIAAPFRALFWVIKTLVLGIRGAYQYFHDFLTYEPEDSDTPEMVQRVVQNPTSLFPHINALRRHIFRCLIALAITTTISFTFAQTILDFLARPLSKGANSLVIIDVTEPIGVFMRVALLTGFVFALPYIVLELVLFIGEGLHKSTRIFLVFFVIPFSTLLFIGGMAFAYFVMLPVAVPFLLNILQFQTSVRASSYVKFVTGVMFWIGVVFEFPMVIFIIARLGWVKAGMLARQWRIAIVAIAIVSAFITPTVDPVNMAIVMGPMILLYFFSIGLAYIAQRGRTAPEQPTSASESGV